MEQTLLPYCGDTMATKDSFWVLNPATSSPLEMCPLPSIEQIDQIIESARSAQPKWWQEGDTFRRKKLEACADRLEAHAEDLATLLTKEQGKPLKDANREVKGAVHYFRTMAKTPIKDEVITDTEKVHTKITYKPLGVVAAISAWNYPIALAAWKIAPSLLTGNAVILKPSPDTPLSSLLLCKILGEVLPKGLVGIVTGHEKEGQHLVTHPHISKVSFTGSVGVGKLINQAASSDLKRVTWRQ